MLTETVKLNIRKYYTNFFADIQSCLSVTNTPHNATTKRSFSMFGIPHQMDKISKPFLSFCLLNISLSWTKSETEPQAPLQSTVP